MTVCLRIDMRNCRSSMMLHDGTAIRFVDGDPCARCVCAVLSRSIAVIFAKREKRGASHPNLQISNAQAGGSLDFNGFSKRDACAMNALPAFHLPRRRVRSLRPETCSTAKAIPGRLTLSMDVFPVDTTASVRWSDAIVERGHAHPYPEFPIRMNRRGGRVGSHRQASSSLLRSHFHKPRRDCP